MKKHYIQSLNKAHQKFLNLGFNPIPAGSFTYTGQWDKKKPPIKWSQYQDKTISQPINYETFKKGPDDNDLVGIGIICGHTSKGLEVIDVDMKNDPTKLIISKVFKQLEKTHPELIKQMPKAMTQSGGWHFYYFVDEPIKTATRGAYKLLKSKEGADLVEIITYPRYIRVAPSLGYKMMHNTSLEDIPRISVQERNELIESIKSIEDETIQKPKSVPQKVAEQNKQQYLYTEVTVSKKLKGSMNEIFQNNPMREYIPDTEWECVTVTQDFNRSYNVLEILYAFGFKYAYEKQDVTFVIRPDSGAPTLAPHSGSVKNNTAYLFSTGDSKLPEEVPLSPINFWMINKGIPLSEQGYKKAVKQLEKLGYGTV